MTAHPLTYRLEVSPFALQVTREFQNTQNKLTAFVKPLAQIQEHVSRFVKENLPEILKLRSLRKRVRQGNYHASVSKTQALVELVRSLPSWLLSLITQPKPLPNLRERENEPHRQHAPPSARPIRCANTFQNELLKRGCLEG